MQDERKTKLALTRELQTLRAKLKKLEKSTDRLRQSEKALRESETAARARADELDSVMAATPSITFIARDPGCRHMTSSFAALRVLRLPVNANTSKSAPIGERPETFRAMKDGRELRPEELPVQIAAATREWVKDFEMTLAFDDGTERDIVGDAVPLFDAEGKVRGAVGSFLDITERKRMEEQLRQAKEQYQQLVENINEVVFSLDDGGTITYVSPAVSVVGGYIPAELSGRPFSDVILPEDLTIVYSGFQRVIKGELGPSEFRILTKSGDVRWVRSSSRPIVSDGKVVGISGSLMDITERKQAEKALRDGEARFRALAESALVGTYVLQDDKYAYVNPAMARVFGYSVAEMTGMSAREIVQPCDHGMVGENIRSRISGEVQTMQYEVRGRHKDGSTRDVEVYGSRMEMNGRPALIGTLIDITERKQTEEALRKNAEHLSRILEATSGGVWDWNIISGDASFSPRYSGMLGYSPNEFATAYKAWKTLVHPDDFERVNQEHSDHFHKNKKFSVEFRMREKSGHWHWVHSRGLLIERDKEGNPLRMVGTHTDIQERKVAEERLITTQEQLHSLAGHLQSVREEERKHLAQEFHDQLGQTLTAVKMDLSLLLRAIADPGKEPSRSLIAQGIESSQDMIDRAIGTIREIMNELRPEMLDQLGIVPTLEWEAEWFSSHSGISCTFDTEVGEIALGPDKGIALYRIFQEAITNVARHAMATNVKVTLRKDGPDLVLEIKDNGVGVSADAEHKARSFGLISMRERAILLGGTVEIRGVRGKGTTVLVRLPFAQTLADGGTVL